MRSKEFNSVNIIKSQILRKIRDLHLRKAVEFLLNGDKHKFENYIEEHFLKINELVLGNNCITSILQNQYIFSNESIEQIVKNSISIFLNKGGSINYLAMGYAMGRHQKQVENCIENGINNQEADLEFVAMGYAIGGHQELAVSCLNMAQGSLERESVAQFILVGCAMGGHDRLLDQYLQAGIGNIKISIDSVLAYLALFDRDAETKLLKKINKSVQSQMIELEGINKILESRNTELEIMNQEIQDLHKLPHNENQTDITETINSFGKRIKDERSDNSPSRGR